MVVVLYSPIEFESGKLSQAVENEIIQDLYTFRAFCFRVYIAARTLQSSLYRSHSNDIHDQ